MSDWLTGILTGIGGLGFGGIGVALLNRDKTEAEVDEHEAAARLSDAQAESMAVTAIKEALQEVRTNSAEKDKRMTAMDEQMSIMRSDIKRLEREGHRRDVALAAHGQWDLLVVAEVRLMKPNFPEPPPLLQFDPEFNDEEEKG